MTTYDAVVIGGGVNGLTCAAMLAKRGLRTALVEKRDTLGGCAAEGDIAPGFRAPTLAHATGPVRRDVVEDAGVADARAPLRRLVNRCLRAVAGWTRAGDRARR